MEETYERLPEVVKINGLKIPGLTAKLIKRTENKAIYYRWDNVYEVFRITKADETKIFQTVYPKMERYPSSDDFGKTAWNYRDKKRAMDAFDGIPDEAVYIPSNTGGDASDDL